MKKICIIGQFPPPIHGLSKAIDTLYNSKELQTKFSMTKIDITKNKDILKHLNEIKKSDSDVFYFTISQSKMGNIRDLIILKTILRKNKKCIIHLHGGGYKYLLNKVSKIQRKINYNTIKLIDAAIVLGKSLEFNFKDLIDDEKIYIVHNCCDEQFICSQEQLKMKVSKERKIKNVLYLSNFIRSKGYDKVLELAKLEKYNFEKTGKRTFHFNFAGRFFEESEKKYFENYISVNKLSDFISYHGIVSGEEKKKLLYDSDIFILLTSYQNEGQPISIIEAMANGSVIISTNHAGISDIVENNINGFLVDEKNIEQIYNIMLNIKDYSKFAIQNSIKINNEFSEKKYISDLEKIFEEV